MICGGVVGARPERGWGGRQADGAEALEPLAESPLLGPSLAEMSNSNPVSGPPNSNCLSKLGEMACFHRLKYTKSIDNRVFSLYLFDVWVQTGVVLI